jgi:hypothetical protein
MTEKSSQPTIQIALTPEQQAQVKQATGKAIATLQLKLDELDQRLAPALNMN